MNNSNDNFKPGRSASEEWRSICRHLELDGGVLEADRMLIERLGHEATSSHAFAAFLSAIPKGHGYGDDSGAILLPADVMFYALDEDWIEPDFFVVIRVNGIGDTPTEIARMSLSRFMFYATFAVTFHSRFVNKRFDAWTVIERMTVSCSRSAQFARLPEKVRTTLSRMNTDWV